MLLLLLQDQPCLWVLYKLAKTKTTQSEAVLDVHNVRRMDTRAILHVGSLLDDFSPTAKLRNVTGIMSLEMYGQT